MRSVRMLLGVMTLALVGGCAQANASQRNAVWVEVSPGQVQTGAIVAIRAACTDNSSPATVNSTAFGAVTVKPKATYLSAEVTVPPNASPGRHNVTVNCSDGQTATTTLTVIQPTPSQPKPTMGPHTGGGYLGNEGAGGG